VSALSQSHPEHAIVFGPFRLLPRQQILLDGDTPIRIGSRAIEILTLLLQNAGEVVEKDEIIRRVWPKTFVEEANLRVHIAALRKALGGDAGNTRFIITVPGRGYSFVAPVSQLQPAQQLPVPAAQAVPNNLPRALGRMIGRAEVVNAISEQLPREEFVTILGAGGIGKTTVALAVAHRLSGSYPDGIRFVDLSPLTEGRFTLGAVALALGLPLHAEDPVPALIDFLRDKRLLLVLDSCEHVIDETAALIERVRAAAPTVHVLATSREPLRAEGEHVHRLAPLAVPPPMPELNASEALTFPAVQLFIERAGASSGGFELGDEDAPVIAEICRRLDGIALAIEIVAGHVEVFGVPGLASALDDKFQLLMEGRRTSLPRHRTLSATLDWSYTHLAEPERIVLRRLAVFAGPFTMPSAMAIVGGAELSAAGSLTALTNLVNKSLVSADLRRTIAFYRLLDTTRVYATQRLEECGERDRLARLHADHYRALLEQAQEAWQTRPAAQWLQEHRHLLDNIRAALDWTFSPAGDARIGVALTIAAVPLFFELSLTRECVERVGAALAALPAARSAKQEMHLHTARAWSLMQTRGSVPETEAEWTRVLALAESQNDLDYRLRALWGLWAGLLNRCELKPALAIAERFSRLAEHEVASGDIYVGQRMVGYILHLLGRQNEARDYIEAMLRGYESPTTGAAIIRFVFDQRATAECFLARILWLQGYPDQAMSLIEEILGRAEASEDVLSLCQVLVQGACPVAFFVGDMAKAEKYVAMLLGHSERQGFLFWRAFGRCFRGVLSIRGGQLADGLERLRSALEELRQIQFGVYYGVFLSDYAEGLGRAGRMKEALDVIGDALARSERNEELWYMPELMRIKGVLSEVDGEEESLAAAKRCFEDSVECAKRQGAASWELRSTTDLARVLESQNRTAEAHDRLAPVHARFAEGFATRDLMEANALLARLQLNRHSRRRFRRRQ
jgi:predicted ATPase/DNA-binding winged helix-turn-helix (wHTH) protein